MTEFTVRVAVRGQDVVDYHTITTDTPSQARVVAERLADRDGYLDGLKRGEWTLKVVAFR